MKTCLLLALVCAHHPRPLALFGFDVAAKTLDYVQTERDFRDGGFQEHNPMVRPLLGHPAALSGYGVGYALGAAFVGSRMRSSRYPFIRRLWWVPQTLDIGESVYGFAYTRRHYVRSR